MNFKKIIVGGLVGGIVFFLLGYVFYGLLFTSFFESVATPQSAGTMRPMEKLYWPGLVVGNMAFGFLIAYVFVKANVSSIVSGLLTGAAIGLLVSSAYDFTSYGVTFLMKIKGVVADIGITTIMAAIVGAIVAAVIGRNNK